jgi:hypothetical protein
MRSKVPTGLCALSPAVPVFDALACPAPLCDASPRTVRAFDSCCVLVRRVAQLVEVPPSG